MAYANTDSVVASDLNNMLRGLVIDNTTHTLTGTTNETALASESITADTIGATGTLHLIAGGTITDVAGAAKTIKLYLGSTAVATISRTGANAQDWFFDAWCFNTSASAQRWVILYSTTDATTVTMDYTTSAEDSSSALTFELTGTLADATDTITGTVFNVFIVQPA